MRFAFLFFLLSSFTGCVRRNDEYDGLIDGDSEADEQQTEDTRSLARNQQASDLRQGQNLSSAIGASYFDISGCQKRIEMVKDETIIDFVRKTTSWCDPNLVPVEMRAPKKLQGLFWLKGLDKDDFGVCMSRGLWHEDTRTLSVHIYSDFLYYDTWRSLAQVYPAYLFNQGYNFTFTSADLTSATIKAFSNVGVHTDLMNMFLRFDFVQDINSTDGLAEDKANEANAGDKWRRPSFMRILNVKVHEYEAWRVLDGDLKVNEENANAMGKALQANLTAKGARLYWGTLSDGPCNNT